jgi:hypothetical protein
MAGRHIFGRDAAESVSTLPEWGASDEGREIYTEDTKKRYFGTDTEWSGYGGGGLSWSLIATNTNAEAENGYLVNASSGNITLTLPASPSEGDAVGICDAYKKATTNTITVGRNGENIDSVAEDLIVDIDGAGFTLVYVDSTRGWEISNDIGYGSALANIVEDTTPQLGGMLDVNGQAIGDGTLELLKFSETGSAVNEITIKNAATGNFPALMATGEADTGLNFENDQAEEMLVLDAVASAVNEITVKNAATGSGPEITATGTDSNIDIEMIPKGTGSVALADAPLTRPEIKDYSETVKVHGSLSGATNADLEDGNVHTFTVGGAFTLSLTNPPANTKAGSITFIITNGDSSTLTWDTDIDWVDGTAPVLTETGVDVVTCVTTDNGTTWLGFVVGLDVKAPA